ncbi:MAG: helix-turn-helix domain-containing protein [bacterium]|nr:helix-turn-helix domain-containing protein [bacterium]
MEAIPLVEGTHLPVRATLRQMNTPRSTFYGWYQRYIEDGFEGLHDKKPAPRPRWNATPEKVQKWPPVSPPAPRAESSAGIGR